MNLSFKEMTVPFASVLKVLEILVEMKVLPVSAGSLQI